MIKSSSLNFLHGTVFHSQYIVAPLATFRPPLRKETVRRSTRELVVTPDHSSVIKSKSPHAKDAKPNLSAFRSNLIGTVNLTNAKFAANATTTQASQKLESHWSLGYTRVLYFGDPTESESNVSE